MQYTFKHNGDIVMVNNGSTTTFSPIDDNNAARAFLEDWKNGAEVLNADGTPAPYVAPETPLTTGE